jgi:hypothetical protein
MWKKWAAVLLLVLVLSAGTWWGVTGINPLFKAGDLGVRLLTSEESKIAKLEPGTQSALLALMADLNAQGLHVYVGQTLRTKAEEKAVHDAGATGAGLVYSWHELGRAVDLYPIDPDTGHPDLHGARVDLFRQMADTAANYGFTSLAFNGDGSRHLLHTATGHTIWDGGHLEFKGPYTTIAQAVEAEGKAFGLG